MKPIRWSVIPGLAVALLAGVATANDAAPKRVTFYKDVLPILQERCQVCHREGGANLGGMVAPMAFTSYDTTRPWAKSIAENVASGKMPPWHAAPEFDGVFENERIITPEERDTLVAWARTGAARGNPTDAPEAREWPNADGWSIGEPDLVVKMADQPFFIGDDIVDTYEYFNSTITSEMLPEARWMKAIEFRPGSPVVHHIIATPLGGIAPGNDPTIFPDGMGRLLQPGTNVNWQMHYHKEPGPGTGTYDLSKAAIKFYDKDAEIDHIIRDASLGRFDFRVPAGDPNYSIQTSYTFDEDAKIVSFMPHMHLRGKSAKYEAFYPDGTSKVLLDVPHYDFNWQTRYQFSDFEFVPAGTKLVLTTAWDNSADNPYNPDPTANVTFGQPTTAEMSFGFMNYIKAVDKEDIQAALSEQGDGFGGRGRRGGNRGGGPNIDLAQLAKNFDTNGDGLLQESEAPEFMKRFFPMIDGDQNGELSAEEIDAANRMLQQRRGNHGGGASSSD
jgi:mono/diheme cytochrome c family protein